MVLGRWRLRRARERPVRGDRSNWWRDGVVFVAVLALIGALLGGGAWAGFTAIDRAQHHAPARTQVTVKVNHGNKHATAVRTVQLSSTALPANPQVGQDLSIPVFSDSTASVDETILYEGDHVVNRTHGLAPAVSWTPKSAGDYKLKVVLSIDGGDQVVSPVLDVQVGQSQSAPPGVDPKVVSTAMKLVAAINKRDWDRYRQLDPGKADWTNATLDDQYRGLVRDLLVPLAGSDQGAGTTRLRAGLVAQEQQRTSLFCVTWDVNPTQTQVRQVYGRRLGDALPPGTPASQVQDRLAAACSGG